MKSINKYVLSLVVLSVCQPVWADKQLTWTDCLHQASQNHPDLISAQEEIHQEKDNQTIAASSLWPHLSASLSAINSRTNSSRVKTDSTTYDYGLSGSQLLFDGMRTVNNVRISKENVKASQWNFHFISSQVRFRLRTSFVNLLKAQDTLKLSQDIYAIRKQNLDLITLRYNAGTEHKGALMTAQANLAQAQFEIHQADRNLKVAQRNLIKEIGAKSFEAITVRGDFDVRNKYEQAPDIDAVVDQNPQLLKLSSQINAASFGVKSNEGSFWPSVSLEGDAGKSDTAWPPKTNNADLGIRLSWPLIEGGSRAAALDQSKSVVRGLEAQRRSLKDALILTLEQSWADLKDALELVSVQNSFLKAAEERAKIAQQQYSVGLLNFDNWTIIEDNLVTIKKKFLDTQANALLAEASWIQAQGRTLEYENE